MKNQITFLFIAFLSTVTAGNETVSRCNGTQTTIRQVLKTSLEDLIKQQCPSGWYRILDSCIFVPQESLDFEEASKRCGQLVDNGRLFEPMSKMQNNVVHSLIKELYGVENEQNYWIGISDRELEGQFVYRSSSAPMAFQYWGHTAHGGDEPNGGRNQNCLSYLSKHFIMGELNDEFCNRVSYFICEKLLM